MSKKTIMIGFRNSGLAHFERCLYIADLLYESKKYRIVLLLTENKYSFLRRIGCSKNYVVEIVQDLPEKNPDCHAFYDSRFIRQQVIGDIKLIKKYNPALIIADHRVSLYIASEYTKKEWILVENASRSRYYQEAFGMPRNTNVSLIRQAQFEWSNFNRNLIIEQYKPILDEFGISSTISFVNQIGKPFKIFLPDVPLFGKVGKNAKTIYLGPCFWKGFDFTYEDKQLNKVLSNKPILVTFGGTMFDQNRLNQLIAYIADSKRYAVVTTGENLRNDFVKKSENIYVGRLLPLCQILPRCSLQICHGGHITVLRGLLSGVPSICIPYNHDQLHTAERVHELECGINLNSLKAICYDYKSISFNAKNITNDQIFDAISTMEERSHFRRNVNDVRSYILSRFSEKYRQKIIHHYIHRLSR